MESGLKLFLTIGVIVVVAAIGMVGANNAKKAMDESGNNMQSTANDMTSGLTWN